MTNKPELPIQEYKKNFCLQVALFVFSVDNSNCINPMWRGYEGPNGGGEIWALQFSLKTNGGVLNKR